MKYILILLATVSTLAASAQSHDYDYSFEIGLHTSVDIIMKDTVKQQVPIQVVKKGKSLQIMQGTLVIASYHLLYRGVDTKANVMVYTAGGKNIFINPSQPILQVEDLMKDKIDIYQ